MKNKKMYIIIAVVAFCIFCCLVAPFLPDDKNVQNQDNNGIVEDSDNNEVEYTKNEKINKFVNEFNKINPDYAFDTDMISNNHYHKIYVRNTNFRNIEILAKTDNGRDMISIQMEKYGDTTDLKNMFNAMMKVFIKDITEEKINELWNQLLEGKYSIDYSENANALKYENVYMSFSDSGAVEVYGKSHFCFARIYGEYK